MMTNLICGPKKMTAVACVYRHIASLYELCVTHSNATSKIIPNLKISPILGPNCMMMQHCIEEDVTIY